MNEVEYINNIVNDYVSLFKKYNVDDWGQMYFKTIRNFLNAVTDTSNSYLFRKTINSMLKKKIILKKRVNKRFIYTINISKKSKKKSLILEW